MKRFFIFSVLLCSVSAIGQGGPVGSFTAPPVGPTFLRDVFRNKDLQQKPSGNVEGSVFLNDTFLWGRIKAVGRTQTYDSVRMKLNIEKNTIHFLDENNEEMTAALKIEAVMITDNSSPLNNTVYLADFDQQPGFFQLLEDGGKLKLLKRLRLFVWETQPVNSEKIKHMEIQGDLYLSSGSTLYNAAKSCSAIRDAFVQNDKLVDYINQNGFKCNKEEDLRKIVKYSAGL